MSHNIKVTRQFRPAPRKKVRTLKQMGRESVKKGFTVIRSIGELEKLAEIANETKSSFDKICGHMTKEHADCVRKARVDLCLSWRSVAELCYESPLFANFERWAPPSNQLMGMSLCEKAAPYFGEDYMKAPWN